MSFRALVLCRFAAAGDIQRQRNRKEGGYASMRLKVLFAIVMGLLAAVLVPVSSQLRSVLPTAALAPQPAAQLAASAARMRPTPTPTAAPPAPAANCALIVPADP